MTTPQRSRPASPLGLFSPQAMVDPYPLYAMMRGAPRELKLGPFELWLLTRYDDVQSAFKRSEAFSSLAFRETRPDPTFQSVPQETLAALREVMRPDVPTVINSDPPQHGRYRGILNRGFTPREMGTLEARIREIATRLVDEMLARGEPVGSRPRPHDSAARHGDRRAARRRPRAPRRLQALVRRVRESGAPRRRPRAADRDGARVQRLLRGRDRAPPQRAVGRPDQPARARRDVGGAALAARAARLLPAPARRRERDHHQPARQRGARAARQPGRVRAPARRAGARAERRRGDAALRPAGAGPAAPGGRPTSRWAARRSRPARA